MGRKAIVALLMAMILTGTCLAAPETKAPSCILMDAATGTVLYELDADHQLAPASVTKVMTLLLVFVALMITMVEVTFRITKNRNSL